MVLPIIEHFNILKGILGRLAPCAALAMVDEFALECPEEAFDTGVVPAVAGAAHAGGDSVLVEQPLVARGGILTAAVRVVQDASHGGPVRQRHRECTLGQVHGQMGAHGLADDSMRVEIKDYGLGRASPQWSTRR